ncbi:MAG: RnfABCDGE type electron transport complex subunit D, partial [Thermoanaerobaculia bacterium]
MVEAPNKAPATPKEEAIEPGLQVAPGPHLSSSGLTTQRLMVDVLIALVPVMSMALFLFRWFAVLQVGICVVSC